LAIDVENDRIIVKHKESVACVVHERAEARLTRAQLLLRLSQLRDVLQNAKLAHGPPGVVPSDIALAVAHSHCAVRTHHPVFHVVAWTATSCRGGSGFVYARPIFQVNQLQPSPMPLRQVERLHSENSTNLVRKSHAIGPQVPLPPAKMRDALSLFQ